LLHPAYEAGFDKVVLEAMATGVIPLTSIPSFEPILGLFGLHIKENSIEDYARRIQEVSSMDEKERNELSRKLRNIVVSAHSISTLPERIFGV
jgi:glycosyltransferase involved in cell wall biosynthesis